LSVAGDWLRDRETLSLSLFRADALTSASSASRHERGGTTLGVDA
jgi:hypothetical protein